MATTDWGIASTAPGVSTVAQPAPRPELCPITSQAVAYVLLAPLVIFAVHGGFSFEHRAWNSGLGAVGGKMAVVATSDESMQERLQSWAALLLCLGAMFPYSRRIAALCQLVPLHVVLPLYAIASALWSQDMWLSLRSGIFLLINVLFALYLVVRFTPRQQMQLVIWTGTIVAVLNILLALLWPQVGLDHQLHEGAWQGIFTQKNVCAEATLFLLTPAVALDPRGRYGQLLRAIYIFLCMLVVGMTQSRTGWAMTAIYLVLAGLLRSLGRFSRKDALPLAALLGTALLAAVAVLIQFSSTLLAVAARSGSLSGRQQIWSAVTRSILNRPLGGYGFGAFWSLLNGEASRVFAATGWIVTGAHNGFLNLVLELGLMGMALVTLTFVQAFRHAGSAYYPGRSPYIDWCIGIVFLTLVYNLDERTLMATQYLPWMLYVLACAGLARAAQDKAWTHSDAFGMEQG